MHDSSIELIVYKITSIISDLNNLNKINFNYL